VSGAGADRIWSTCESDGSSARRPAWAYWHRSAGGLLLPPPPPALSRPLPQPADSMLVLYWPISPGALCDLSVAIASPAALRALERARGVGAEGALNGRACAMRRVPARLL
jgi:hypothetical protein